ncbi:MAG: aldehyde dehydrogenase family protein, partial [Actinomycetales bacterium]|nr:aldehyde dehydrogenase family protein [Actinomycetales bacterium]
MPITALDEARVLASVPKGLLINGVWRDSSDGSTLDVFDPATGKAIATIASATPADGMAAMDAAAQAQA